MRLVEGQHEVSIELCYQEAKTYYIKVILVCLFFVYYNNHAQVYMIEAKSIV